MLLTFSGGGGVAGLHGMREPFPVRPSVREGAGSDHPSNFRVCGAEYVLCLLLRSCVCTCHLTRASRAGFACELTGKYPHTDLSLAAITFILRVIKCLPAEDPSSLTSVTVLEAEEESKSSGSKPQDRFILSLKEEAAVNILDAWKRALQHNDWTVQEAAIDSITSFCSENEDYSTAHKPAPDLRYVPGATNRGRGAFLSPQRTCGCLPTPAGTKRSSSGSLACAMPDCSSSARHSTCAG